MFKSRVQQILAAKAKHLIDKFHPTVIAITGSIGKTSTKDAVALVLKKKHTVLETQGNLNTEFGLPLTILGMKPATNPFGWFRVTARVKAYRPKEYYEFLVLEYGIDHPGDMAKLAEIAKPSIVVETGVERVHEEFFSSHDHLAKEKASLLSYLPDNGLAVLNFDNPASRAMANMPGAWQRVTYGTNESADVRAMNIQTTTEGLRFTYKPKDRSGVPIFVPIIGKHHVSVLLPALIIAEHAGIPAEEASEALQQFHLPPGRLNLIPGINGSQLIDGSYNAEPASMDKALETLKELSARRRIAILGDMLELGEESKSLHLKIREQVTGVDLVVFVGTHMKPPFEHMQARGSLVKLLYFPDSVAAAKELPNEMKTGDLVLIKGSQGARMERITRALMDNKADAPKLLVRQSMYWLKK